MGHTLQEDQGLPDLLVSPLTLESQCIQHFPEKRTNYFEMFSLKEKSDHPQILNHDWLFALSEAGLVFSIRVYISKWNIFIGLCSKHG